MYWSDSNVDCESEDEVQEWEEMEFKLSVKRALLAVNTSQLSTDLVRLPNPGLSPKLCNIYNAVASDPSAMCDTISSSTDVA